MWEKQDQHGGDRHRLFTAVAESVDIATVLYPGSYVDLAPSFVWPSVTYVDIDQRAGKFFGDEGGVTQLLVEHDADPATHRVRFIRADYNDPLDLDDSEFDLLISLYAGFVSEACTRHLRVGGTLLVDRRGRTRTLADADRDVAIGCYSLTHVRLCSNIVMTGRAITTRSTNRAFLLRAGACTSGPYAGDVVKWVV